MLQTLTPLIDRLDSAVLPTANVIPWGSPVPCFGNPAISSVATLGLNPSNREFVDDSGIELDGKDRRFHTLNSLGITNWSEINEEHLQLISDSCEEYFYRNPYDRWFRKLDSIISGINVSYYNHNLFNTNHACHLDLIPYATACKWIELDRKEKVSLFEATEDTLAVLLRDSPIQILILNGKSVVNHFEGFANITLDKEVNNSWSLRRKSGVDVPGISYQGRISRLSDIELGREVLILGYNHNLQSSYGVSKEVIDSIRDWIATKSEEVF